jgi:putative flippase GtrA
MLNLRRHLIAKLGSLIFDPFKVVKFIMTGLLNTFVGYLLFAFFVFIDLHIFPALAISTALGILFNYFSFGHFVFDNIRSSRVFARFIVSYISIYVVNALSLFALVHHLHLSPYVGQLLYLPLGVILSWTLMNYWVYK